MGGPSCSANPEHLFDVATGKEILRYQGHDNIVVATAISPDGLYAATAGGDNQEIHLWKLATGKRVATLKGQGASLWAAGFAKDGRSVGWGKTWKEMSYLSKNPIEFQLALPQKAGTQKSGPHQAALALSPAPSPSKAKTFLRAQTRHGNWSLARRKGGKYGHYAHLDILQKGKTNATLTRGATDGYDHIAYSFSPDGQTILSGGRNGKLYSYDRKGNRLGQFVGHTGDIWAVGFSPDGRMVISGSHDQTLRLWNANSHELIVTLFHGADNEWAMWTPQGYYTASANGHGLVGWQINRGVDKAADHLSAAQMGKTLYSPEIINKALILASASKAIRQLGGTGDIVQKLLASGMPPKLAMDTPDNQTTGNRSVTLRAQIMPRSGGIGKTVWRVNGVTLASMDRAISDAERRKLFGMADDGSSGKTSLAAKAKQQARRKNQPKTLTRRFALAEGKNIFELRVFNKAGKIISKPVSTTIIYTPGLGQKKPKLHILSIGVNDYWQGSLKLNYAVPDATALADELVKGGKMLYRSVDVTKLLDKEVTVKNIGKTFVALSKKIAPDDVFVFFIAGHGVTHKGQYYFLPQDIVLKNMASLDKQAVSQDQWQAWFGMIPARKSVLLLDTCESGSMTGAATFQMASVRGGTVAQVAAIDRLSRATGRTTISATSRKAPALEGYRGHGVFTYSLLEALALGDTSRDQLIDLSELSRYVGLRVPEISEKEFKFRQVPTVSSQGDFTLMSVVPDSLKGELEGEDGIISRKTSHIVILPAKVFSGPGAGADALKTLGLGTGVTLLRQENGWMLVARKGRRIGYINKSKVVPFGGQ